MKAAAKIGATFWMPFSSAMPPRSIAAQSPAAFTVPAGAVSITDWLQRLPPIPGLTAPRQPVP